MSASLSADIARHGGPGAPRTWSTPPRELEMDRKGRFHVSELEG